MIAIIDYGIGNLASITNALNKLNIKSIITDDVDEMKKASGLILPGVGAAGEGMKNIKERKLDKVLIETVKRGKPFLGICLGMQLLFEKSEEGQVECLGVLKGMVKKFRKERKVPQIGWNQIKYQKQKMNTLQLFSGIPNDSYFYFVNSYYCIPEDSSIIAAKTIYGEDFASVVVQKNIVATQFHPEKSGKAGFNLLGNFARNLLC
ncbi:imidazole glycerol phosphate synthase subunit HisH [Candidatus Gottesmanbacteria bacterium]|nr:imidazole glycerol phosphate synthase subunit HisH [Candidatus Gottesmanbacteria bacterium]